MVGKITARLILLIFLLISFEAIADRDIRASGFDSLNFQTGGKNTRMHIDSSGSIFFDLLTANRVPYIGASGELFVSAVTDTELGYLSGVTSSVQTQLNGKVDNTLTSANIFVGNGSNIATGVAVTGDISISNTGVTNYVPLSITDGDIATLANITTTKIGTGLIDTTEFNRLDGLTGDILTTDSTSTVTNKTFGDALLLTELGATPSTPSAGLKKIYCLSTDDKCYQLNDAGSEVELGAGAGGGTVEVEDEGISLTTAVTKFNFVGDGVTVTEPVADEVEVTIPLAASINTLANVQSVEYYGGNGHGSTNTVIRVFLNNEATRTTGSGVFTAANDSTNGASITFLTDACGSVSYSDVETSGGTSEYGLSINSSELTTGILAITYADRLAVGKVTGSTVGGAVNNGEASWSGCVNAGDVLRPHTNGGSDNGVFGITRFSAQFTENNSVVLTTITDDQPARVSDATTQTLTNNVITKVEFSADFDTDNNWSTVNDNWVAPRSGTVSVKGQVRFEFNATGRRELYVYKNGLQEKISVMNAPAGNQPHVSIETLVEVEEGDTISLRAMQNSGGNLDIAISALSTFASFHYVDAKSLLSQIDLGTVIAPFVADITRQTDWESYTPTLTGFGTTSNENFRFKPK